MSALLDVILPVFLVIGFGYAAVKANLLSEPAIDGLMRFAQNFAVPCLLFRSIAHLDLSAAYDLGLMTSFYAGAFAGFFVSFFGAMLIFGRPMPDAVAIGFAGLFSNSLLLGLAITERAYGTEALQGNYAIISLHAPVLYGFGIALMEWARTRGRGLSGPALLRQIARAILSQSLVIGILLGFAVNLAGNPLPDFFWSGIDMIARAAIPVALFGLGGVLVRYRIEGDIGPVLLVSFASLVLHPAITWGLGTRVFQLDTAALRSAVVTAAMAPGVNAYMFAHMYGVGKRVNASAVLVATAASILTAWAWLRLLP
ncbi:AEC family transporter [Tabrizicola sp.]|jgi:malonate transporter and related proteins|uniref:AEC family transporter n=1 Tax=Tabrizicola sp. TaxID=2005166 RepID=UPI000BC97136|nr:AEC family transporter [Tabrizicola sp.]MBY0350909.1 AEC family transporter [Tabrizicola sp.]MDK2773868.1 AEC family transporter [Tabrizicola sp.]OYX21573.1 MAG: malonate transporter [Rhodobacterales bacterium 32-66-9]